MRDLTYCFPPEVRGAATRLGERLDEADVYCRCGADLLTLTTPPNGRVPPPAAQELTGHVHGRPAGVAGPWSRPGIRVSRVVYSSRGLSDRRDRYGEPSAFKTRPGVWRTLCQRLGTSRRRLTVTGVGQRTSEIQCRRSSPLMTAALVSTW